MMIVKTIGMFICFFVIPFIIGSGVTKKMKHFEGEGVLALLFGYAIILAAFQIICLPFIYFKGSLNMLTIIFGGIAAAFGLFFMIKNRRYALQIGKRSATSFVCQNPIFFMAICVIILQVFVCVFSMHLDQDDAFYVATATTAVETNSIFKVDPYMGFEYDILPARYVLSPFPIFLAVVSNILKIHPTILAHTVFPAIIIPLAYLVYWMIGKKLFIKNKRAQATFLLIVAVIQMFSYYSVYTQGTFLLLRSWQGKAVLANVLLPLIFYMGLSMMEEEKNKTFWFLLFCMVSASALVSSMGIMLAPISVGLIGIWHFATKRNWGIIWKSLLCCSASLVYAIIYIFIR